MNTEQIILKYALQNAFHHKGKADFDAVMKLIFASEPELRLRPRVVGEDLKKTIKKVNKMLLEEQKERLESMDPSLLKKKEPQQQSELPELPGTEGKVVTRFAPSPTGPLNISQLLRAAMISYLYAKKYNGKFILRFEDTDASKIQIEYYEWIREDLKSTGIKWNKEVIESKNMKLYYKTAESLIKDSMFYVCLCSKEKVGEYKKAKKACSHRSKPADDNLENWKKMLKGGYGEGKAVVRLKTSMSHPNPALRDPVMLRISSQFHPLVEDRYIVWPLYNYANVVDDHNSNVTHVFRGKEHEHNTAIQKIIYEHLGWSIPYVINFGMIHTPGKKLHTRDIKTGIHNGEYSGWDDPRLHTVRALVRRGFQPKAFKLYAIQTGLTKTDIKLNWETFESLNRKVLDPLSDRYIVILDPVKISVINLPLEIHSIRQPFHPDFPKRGSKQIPLEPTSIYITSQDYDKLRKKEFRLRGLGNFTLKKNTAEYTNNRINPEMRKIQWVSEPNVKARIVTPDKELTGIGEPLMVRLKIGEPIRMERIGFGRVDSKIDNEIIIYFAHR